MVDKVLELEERTKIQILSPVISRRKGTHKRNLDKLKKMGLLEL